MKNASFISVCILLCGLNVAGQVSNETFPISWNLPLSENGTVWRTLSFIEPTGLLAEDALEGKSKPMRFAKSRTVNCSPSTDGRWSNLSNGDRIWKLGIKCTGSFSVGLMFSEFSIPAGARMYIYSEDKSQHLGPFTRSDNRATDEVLVTPPIYGEKLVVEYYEPFAFRGQGNFLIKSVQHGYRDLQDWNNGTQDDCLNILEPSAGNSQISSAVLMMVVDNGQRIATGTMVNNSSGNSAPYLLTSLNALKGNSQGWVFLFDVTEHECSQMNNCWTTAVCGAVPVSVDSTNGTALMSLRSAPPGNWAVYYSGWNTNSNGNFGNYKSIQHANGFVQSVANYQGQLESVVWNGFQTKRIANWNNGITAAASIGSPLFDENNNLMGIYVGGDLDCEGSGADYFSEFSASFSLYNSFLDPLRSGINTLNGLYPVSMVSRKETSDFHVSFFPNPARNWIYTQVNDENLLSEIQIFDAQGRVVRMIVPQTPTIQLDDLQEGLYTVHFISGQNRSIQKLLIR